ncbi:MULTISPECIES: hypothetical protein [unclassified Clostridium]|uniref:hypothetical protein n=1 Tax=unclassified Clostridium TaxID=2614128 RepID=UPI003F93A6D3
MGFIGKYGFYLTSVFIVLGLIFVNWRTFFIHRKESKFTEILISISKIFIMYFIISLNYSLFYGKINYISILLHICKILIFLGLLLKSCKVIILKHLIIYDNDILLRKNIDKLYIQNDKLIIKTNNKTFRIDIDVDDKSDKILLKNYPTND